MKKNRILFILAFLTVSASSFGQQVQKPNRNTVVSTGTSRSMPNIELQFKFTDIVSNSMLNIDVIEIENNKNVKKTELHNSIQTQVILKKKTNPLFLFGVNYMNNMVMINKLTLDRNTVMSKIIPKEGEKLKYITLSQPLNLYDKSIPLILVYNDVNGLEESSLKKTLNNLTKDEVVEYFSKKSSHFYLISYKLTKIEE